MNLLTIREKEIFETLKALKGASFVLIGGYAVNAHTPLPRFSVDCDIVVDDIKELDKIEKRLLEIGYQLEENPKELEQYYGSFRRYEKKLEGGFIVSVDILVKEVLDRQTGATFLSSWVFNNSAERVLRGRTIIEEHKLRIIDVEALFAMKFVSCRLTDIRDIFMLSPQIKNQVWVKEEISKRADFMKNFLKIKNIITAKQFKDQLQGVYGLVDSRVFEKHKNALLSLNS